MDCKVFLEKLDGFIDEELTPEERAAMLKHAESCPACRRELEKARALKAVLGQLDARPVVPLSAQAAWREAIRREDSRRKMKKLFRTAGSAAAALLVLIGGTFALRHAGLIKSSGTPAAARNAGETETYIEESYAGAPEAALETDGEMEELDFAMSEAASGTAPASGALRAAASEDAGALLARSASREILARDFDAACDQVRELAEEYGGYLALDKVAQAQEDQAAAKPRTATLRAMVPQEDLDAFLAAVDYLGDVALSEQGAEDVSGQAYDAQGRLNTLALERDRLNQLIAEAEDAAELEKLNGLLEENYASADAVASELNAYQSRAEMSQVDILLLEGE